MSVFCKQLVDSTENSKEIKEKKEGGVLHRLFGFKHNNIYLQEKLPIDLYLYQQNSASG
jgi:hypothetical protein